MYWKPKGMKYLRFYQDGAILINVRKWKKYTC